MSVRRRPVWSLSRWQAHEHFCPRYVFSSGKRTRTSSVLCAGLHHHRCTHRTFPQHRARWCSMSIAPRDPRPQVRTAYWLSSRCQLRLFSAHPVRAYSCAVVVCYTQSHSVALVSGQRRTNSSGNVDRGVVRAGCVCLYCLVSRAIVKTRSRACPRRAGHPYSVHRDERARTAVQRVQCTVYLSISVLRPTSDETRRGSGDLHLAAQVGLV